VAKPKTVASARDWASDKYQHIVVQRNVLALITLASLVVSVISVLAVYSLTPLKSVEPYLLTIDEKSGYTQKVEPVSRNRYASNEAVDRYFLAKYVFAREAYTAELLKYNINVVRVMSAQSVFYKYRTTIASDNPKSLPSLLKGIGQREVRIRSISYIQNPPVRGKEEVTPTKIAQVRFVLLDTFGGTRLQPEELVATISFEYAQLDLNPSEQLVNPLNFTVTSYQVQRELS
jgi:type IV secretion system protein VirB8